MLIEPQTIQISNMLTEVEITQYQQQIYEYFATGYDFEVFLKEYLTEMGLDEVEVTQRSKDGGIDLVAIRKGVGDFSESDKTNYYIQAKRYHPNNKVPVRAIRELKGTIPFGAKGIFITTSEFTADGTKESNNDPSKPVVLLDGKSLVISCIDKGIGFVYKPIFSAKRLDVFIDGKEEKINTELYGTPKNGTDYIEKMITKNDVRARIISVPSSIMSKFSKSDTRMDVIINGKDKCNFSINKGRNYFAGVTDIFRKYGLLSDDGIITSKKAKWRYDEQNNVVYINIEDKISL
ncbi:restriction endonuclease [Tissierellaceae bacterium HCP3S3_D8]